MFATEETQSETKPADARSRTSSPTGPKLGIHGAIVLRQNARNVRAGLAVLGATMALFCTVGYMNAFGVFQQYYKTGMLKDQSDSDISWIGSVTIFFLYALAPLSGLLVDRIGPTVSQDSCLVLLLF